MNEKFDRIEHSRLIRGFESINKLTKLKDVLLTLQNSLDCDEYLDDMICESFWFNVGRIEKMFGTYGIQFCEKNFEKFKRQYDSLEFSKSFEYFANAWKEHRFDNIAYDDFANTFYSDKKQMTSLEFESCLLHLDNLEYTDFVISRIYHVWISTLTDKELKVLNETIERIHDEYLTDRSKSKFLSRITMLKYIIRSRHVNYGEYTKKMREEMGEEFTNSTDVKKINNDEECENVAVEIPKKHKKHMLNKEDYTFNYTLNDIVRFVIQNSFDDYSEYMDRTRIMKLSNLLMINIPFSLISEAKKREIEQDMINGFSSLINLTLMKTVHPEKLPYAIKYNRVKFSHYVWKLVDHIVKMFKRINIDTIREYYDKLSLFVRDYKFDDLYKYFLRKLMSPENCFDELNVDNIINVFEREDIVILDKSNMIKYIDDIFKMYPEICKDLTDTLYIWISSLTKSEIKLLMTHCNEIMDQYDDGFDDAKIVKNRYEYIKSIIPERIESYKEYCECVLNN